MALAEVALDGVSTRHLTEVGLSDDWHCLEVGAGAGSITRWLSARVGKSGRVLATDIDTRFVEALLPGLGLGNVEVRRHDIVADPPLPAEFDVAHARLLLQH